MKKRIIIIASLVTFLFSSCNISPTDKQTVTFEQYRYNLGYSDLKATGDREILVIPVVFKDCTLNEEQLELEHNNIEKAFFGKSEDTYWESVSSFYEKSSYNTLNLKGKVSDYFYYDKTIIDANAVIEERYMEPTYQVLEDALIWYNENHNDINRFDTDNDKRIDSVWLIYMEEYNTSYFKKYPDKSSINNLSQFLWAYTYWYVRRWNYNFIRPYSYAWASYKFMYEGDKNGIDSHTYIHETGHLLGLEDYYNYDFSATLLGDRTKPCGSLDMMDNNILDHNAYTKYLLGWIKPTEVKEDGVYEISSFQEKGDSLIIRLNDDNNTPFDEYLIIEYYTPTGLNEHDSTYKYTDQIPLGFTESGFKIYHVDSRLGLYKHENRQLVFDSYYDDLSMYKIESKTNLIQIAHSNTTSRSANKKYKLLSLLSPLGKSRLHFKGSYSVHAENKDLFQKGDTLNSFTFNSVENNNISIEIVESNEFGGSIKVLGL